MKILTDGGAQCSGCRWPGTVERVSKHEATCKRAQKALANSETRTVVVQVPRQAWVDPTRWASAIGAAIVVDGRTYLPLRTSVAPVNGDGATDGRLRGEGGQAAALDAAAVQGWRAKAAGIVEQWIADGVGFTSDDLTERAGEPPRPNAIGGLLGGYRQTGRLVAVGVAPSRRPSRRGAILRVWRAPTRRE